MPMPDMSTCRYCGTLFSGKSCLSSSCRNKAWRAAHNTNPQRICRRCSKPFTPRSSAEQYCPSCPNVRELKTNHICPCGNEFTAIGNQRYCSDCRLSRADPDLQPKPIKPKPIKPKPIKPPKPAKPTVIVTCSAPNADNNGPCGREFEQNRNKKYCSSFCRQRAMENTRLFKNYVENICPVHGTYWTFSHGALCPKCP